MSGSLKEIILLVISLIITSILYIMGIHQLEPYLAHLYYAIVIEISALVLLFYYRYLNDKTSKWFWNIIRKQKEKYLKWKLTIAINKNDPDAMKVAYFNIVVENFKSPNREKMEIARLQLDALINKGLICKKNYSILWIDHEANTFEALVKPLLKDGHEITIALNEKEALLKLGSNEYDLILLELIISTGEKAVIKSIPYVDLHLLKKILIDMKLSTPIIVLTFNSDDKMKKKAEKMGVKKFLRKGDCVQNQLKEVIYDVLRSS